MSIINNRVKVLANGTDASTDFILGDPVSSFAAFEAGEVNYTALASDGSWQVGVGTVSGLNLTRGIVEENSNNTTDQMDFSGLTLQIALTLSAKYIDDITNKLDGIEDNATANQTGTEIKVLYEAEPDTNAFDDVAKDKLENIENNATADQIALQVPFTPTVTVTPNDVQNAIEQVDYIARNHSHEAINLVYDPDGDVNFPFDADDITDKTDIQQAMIDHAKFMEEKLFSATGLISGGKIYGTVATSEFHVAAGEGIFSLNYQDDSNLVVPSKIIWDAQIDINISPEADNLSVATVNVLLQKSGEVINVIKIVGDLADSYLKDYIFLGQVHVVEGAITGFTNAPIVARQAESNINDYMVKHYNISGGNLGAVTNALSFWQSGGEVLYPGINWQDTDHRNPNIKPFSALGSDISPQIFLVLLQSGAVVYNTSTVLTAEYDDAGVLTPIPATKATVHMMYVSGLASAQRKLILILGQNLFDDATIAKDSLGNNNPMVLPEETNSMQFIGYIGQTAESIDFNDSNSAWIVSDISGAIEAAAGTTVEWGNITGLLSTQTDLNDRFITLESPDKTVYNDLSGNEPSYADGQLFYSEGTLNFRGHYPDVTLQIGREQHIEIINNTGITIFDGQACKHNGIAGSDIQVELALADTFANSRVLGIATMDIPHGQKGILTTFGIVNGIDTLAFIPGIPLYLSDTIPGEFTDIAPNIVSKVGAVIVSNATIGQMFISIENDVQIPTIIGAISDNPTPNSLPNDLVNYTPIQNYDTSLALIIGVNSVTGTLLTPFGGIYRANVSISISFDNVGNSGKVEIWLAIRNVTDNNLIREIKGFMLKDAETYSFNLNGLVTLEANDEYRLEIKSGIALSNISYSIATFDIESVHIRQ